MNNTTLKLQSHCVYDTRYHLVLTTSGRRKLLTPKILSRFEALAEERAEAWEGELLRLDAGADYVHLNLALPPKVSVATFAGALKTGSSRRLRNEFPALARRKELWSDRYLVLSDGDGSTAATLAEYLDDSPSITGGNGKSAGATLALGNLSKSAAAFLREHPDDASVVLAAAVEAAALQHSRNSNGRNATERTQATSEPVSDDLIDAPEAARRLGISQGSVYYWVKRGKMIAWPTDGRGALAIPAEQITDDGRVLDGIPAALQAIGDARGAWLRLTQPIAGNGRSRTLLERLRAGQVDEVMRRLGAG